MNNRLFIIMYHSVGSTKNEKNLKRYLYQNISIDEDKFEEQILYLKKRGHTFITFEDLYDKNLSSFKKPTIVYFDDGFKDNLINAYPILRKNNVPATIFLVTGILDKTSMLWSILYREVLKKQKVSSDKWEEIIHNIKTKSDSYRLEFMDKFSLGDYNYLFDIFLDWSEVIYLSNNGINFGSHSITHPRLDECSDSKFLEEINHSKKRLESKLNKSIDIFSFPYSRYEKLKLLRLYEVGYKILVSKGKGYNKIPKSNQTKFFLKVISPKPKDSLIMFKLRLYSLNLKK